MQQAGIFLDSNNTLSMVASFIINDCRFVPNEVVFAVLSVIDAQDYTQAIPINLNPEWELTGADYEQTSSLA